MFGEQTLLATAFYMSGYLCRKKNMHFAHPLMTGLLLLLVPAIAACFIKLNVVTVQGWLVLIDYVIAMTGPGDTQEGMERLVQAVMEIDKNILCEELSGNDEDHTIKNISYEMIPLEQAYSSFEAGRMEGESVKWDEASGRISLEYVYLYPPGIPMIVPGERITSTIVQKMVKYKEMGFSIEGLSQENCLLVAGNPE